MSAVVGAALILLGLFSKSFKLGGVTTKGDPIVMRPAHRVAFVISGFFLVYAEFGKWDLFSPGIVSMISLPLGVVIGIQVLIFVLRNDNATFASMFDSKPSGFSVGIIRVAG